MRAKQDRSASYIQGCRWPIHNMWIRIPDVIEDEKEKKITEVLTFAFSSPVERSMWQYVEIPMREEDGRYSLTAEHLQILPYTGLIQHQYSPLAPSFQSRNVPSSVISIAIKTRKAQGSALLAV